MIMVVITKCPQIAFGFSKTCESDCESIKINFTDGLVTQFLLERSCNDSDFTNKTSEICNVEQGEIQRIIRVEQRLTDMEATVT